MLVGGDALAQHVVRDIKLSVADHTLIVTALSMAAIYRLRGDLTLRFKYTIRGASEFFICRDRKSLRKLIVFRVLPCYDLRRI